ncbi:ABC transporter permease [Butyrivibrio sp. MB2005]|uniref:ABC transporter permease n=1 Tax=Butyrivibrio sp. MB2005 TaxID=1280678 RepID=UPI00047B9344|nr:ABC transporter permease [Butyrivibrio sp. MB2005]
MAKTGRKDTLRNIRKQLVSWLSIIIITSFAITAYLGLSYSAFSMSREGKRIYDSTNFHDIQISSNCLLSKDDLAAISGLEGIKEIEGILRSSVRITHGTKTKSAYITSLGSNIDIPMLQSGALPVTKDECAIEQSIADDLSLSIGDKISPLDAYNEKLPELSVETLTITGIFKHAEHMSYDLDEPYCILVTKEAFDEERFDGCYALANIVLEKPYYSKAYDKRYFSLVSKRCDAIKELSDLRSQARYEDYTLFLENQISDSEKDLQNAKHDLALAGRMIPSMSGKTGQVMADLGNMLSVIISKEPSEYKTAPKQISDYDKALIEYNNALQKLEDSKKRLIKLQNQGECDWYVLDRNSNISYLYLKNNAENLHKLTSTFSILFVIIAIMVIFASLSRMLYSQRTLIGASKALGLTNAEIFSKYIIFGLSATVIGNILGILMSALIVEYVIAIGYDNHFIYGRYPCTISILPSIIISALAIATAFLAIYASCSKLMKQTAKKLMSPLAPDSKRESLKNNKFLSKLSLYSRMIILNMQTDILRVLVTIISVAGCCALIVIGFSLRRSISGSLDGQLTEISTYDGKITYNANISDSIEEEITKEISDRNIEYVNLLDKYGSLQIDDMMEFTEFFITDDIVALSKFHNVLDYSTGRSLFDGNSQDISKLSDGIIITNRLSELYNLSVGDNIELIDDMGIPHNTKVSGIMKNYIGRFAIISKSLYENLVDDNFANNTYLIRTGNLSQEDSTDTIIANISELQGFDNYSPSSELTDMFRNVMIVLNLIVWLLIVLSGVLSMFVLLNLANMYLISKHSELTIMRINGFTVKETVIYAVREVIITTSIGIFFGIVFGAVMVYSIIRKMEQVHLMFVRTPDVSAWVISALITVAFSAGIYYIPMSKIKDLSLTDLF